MGYTLVIGHAAAAGEAPANTLAGVRAALHAPSDAMEIDVQLSADGIPVLLHDNTLDRTTNLSGPVSDYTVEQLREANAGDVEYVPTLAEVLQLVQGHLSVLSELKHTPDDPGQDERLVDAVMSVIREHGAEAWAGVHSFSPAMVERARATESRVAAAIISPPVFGEDLHRLLAATLKRGGQAVSVHHSCVTRDLVRTAKFRQLNVWCWTPDDEAEWQRLVECGVDGIITNFPSRLRKLLDG